MPNNLPVKSPSPDSGSGGWSLLRGRNHATHFDQRDKAATAAITRAGKWLNPQPRWEQSEMPIGIERSFLVLWNRGGKGWWRLLIKEMSVWEHCFFPMQIWEKWKELKQKYFRLLGWKHYFMFWCLLDIKGIIMKRDKSNCLLGHKSLPAGGDSLSPMPCWGLIKVTELFRS